jgi:hypothetical protein
MRKEATMKLGKPYYSISIRYKHRRLLPKERQGLRDKHGVDINNRYATREKANAANPDPKIFSVDRCYDASFGTGGF